MAPKLLKLCLQDSAVALHVSTISVRVYFAVYLWSEPFLIVITQILDFAVFLVSKPRQRYFVLNWWWPIASQVMFARMEFWGNSWGCKFATAVFPFTRQSGECILLERSDRGNFVSMKFSSFDNSKFSHFIFWAHWIWLYKCITVWEASFDFILNRFVPIWPEPELSYWRWQMNGSHVIGFKKVPSRWTVEYSQDCQLYSLDSSWIGRF